MSDEDLGSFFEEINQIEAAVVAEVTEPATTTSVSSSSSSSSSKEEPAVSYAPQVISKAPEIVYKASHPVYTYDQPGLSDIQASEENDGGYSAYTGHSNAKQSSSNDVYHSNGLSIAPSLSFRPAPPPVAPPQVPRQDKVFVRKAADSTWVDESLQEWPENDYRIFVGDLAKEVNTEHLAKAFQQYKSFAKAKVIRTKHEAKARGFGFVSFLDPMDCAKAIREQNGKYLASRPMKITKSSWKERDLKEVKKKENKKRKIQESLGLV